MFDLIAFSDKPRQKAMQLFVTLVMILLLGKLVSLLPIMQKLVVFHSIKAANVVWFLAETSALCVFYFLVRYTMDAIPNQGGVMHLLRGIANPLAALIMVILFQELVWQLLFPFVGRAGKQIYFGFAILLIAVIGIWLVLKTYQCSDQLASSVGRIGAALAGTVQPQKTVCGECNAEVSSNARFCDQCGCKMTESQYCPACGVTVTDDQNFCRECGANLKITAKKAES